MTKVPFNPPKLPPKIDYTGILEELMQAHDALGNLNGSLISIANKDLLISPLLTKEAVLSSRIEGTQATIEDVFRYEAEEKTSQIDEKERDVREIINYRMAMNYAIKELKHRPLSENLIKDLHSILLDSVRGRNKERGKLRNMQVFIAPMGATIEEASYVPPLPAELPSLLSNLNKYLNSKTELDPIVQIGIAHYQFEAIHPFMDGNGRIGRLIIPLFLYQRELLTHPLLYVSKFFEEHRKDYYKLLGLVSERGNWKLWLKFFLNAIVIQSLETQKKVYEINLLYNEVKNKISSVNAVYAVNLLDIIFTTPVVSFATIKKRIPTNSNQTIYNLLGKFVKAKILYEVGGRKRNKIFVFRKLFKILNK